MLDSNIRKQIEIDSVVPKYNLQRHQIYTVIQHDPLFSRPGRNFHLSDRSSSIFFELAIFSFQIPTKSVAYFLTSVHSKNVFFFTDGLLELHVPCLRLFYFGFKIFL